MFIILFNNFLVSVHSSRYKMTQSLSIFIPNTTIVGLARGSYHNNIIFHNFIAEYYTYMAYEWYLKHICDIDFCWQLKLKHFRRIYDFVNSCIWSNVFTRNMYSDHTVPGFQCVCVIFWMILSIRHFWSSTIFTILVQ